MEEKLSALETLGVFQGLAPIKLWQAHSNSMQIKDCSFTHKKSVFFTRKRNNVIRSSNKGCLIINQNTGGFNDSRSYKIEKRKREAGQNISFKSCAETKMIKSETDIPENNNKVMNACCDKTIYDSKEKTETSNKIPEIVPAKQNILTKESSLEEAFEEIDSNEGEEANHKIIKNTIPSAVQEWLNHLPTKDSIASSKEDSNCKEIKEDSQNAIHSDENPLTRAQLSREASIQSSSSLDSILDSRRPDPVEIFLNLGFGGLPGIDTENCRIPRRFLVPSKCKGGDWNEFLNRELIQAQNFECSALGFRGLSGPSYRRPSAIVANIIEKLREHAVPQPRSRARFSTVAKMILNEKSVLNKLTPEFQSVLSPDNREFLQNQGKKSPEVPRRRIIFGQKSFAFAHDGEFIEVESSKVEEKTTKDPSIALSANDREEPMVYTNTDVLLKLRRSSLQKQKKVEEDTDVDDVFYVVGNKEHSSDIPYNNQSNNKRTAATTTTTTTTISTTATIITTSINNNNNNNNNINNNSNSNNNLNNSNNNNSNNECSKKAGKIPRRFLSSTNLKALEENNLSETMRLEVEKEIISLSQKIKSISNQDLPSVLQQVKELRSKIENSGQDSNEI